jgi:hypothetical protein
MIQKADLKCKVSASAQYMRMWEPEYEQEREIRTVLDELA